MPSARYIDLTLGSSGTEYTAPADGWIIIDKLGNNSQYCTIQSSSQIKTWAYTIYNNATCQLFIPVRKNEKFYVHYSLTGVTNEFRFIYAVGSAPA